MLSGEDFICMRRAEPEALRRENARLKNENRRLTARLTAGSEAAKRRQPGELDAKAPSAEKTILYILRERVTFFRKQALNGLKLLSADALPDDGSAAEPGKWLRCVPDDYVSKASEAASLRRDRFGRKSEKLRSRLNENAGRVSGGEPSGKGSTPGGTAETAAERYDRLTSEIAALENEIAKLGRDGERNVRRPEKCADRIEELLKELALTERALKEDQAQSDKSGASNQSNQSDRNDASNQYGPSFSDGDFTSGVNEDDFTPAEPKPDNRRRKEKDENESEAGGRRYAPGIAVVPENRTAAMKSPAPCIAGLVLSKHKYGFREMISSVYMRYGGLLAGSLRYKASRSDGTCDWSGDNPASCMSVKLTDETGSREWFAGSLPYGTAGDGEDGSPRDETRSSAVPASRLTADELRELHGAGRFPEHVLNICIRHEGGSEPCLMIDPVLLKNRAAQTVYSLRPLFVGSHVSEGDAIEIAAMFCSGLMPRSRICSFLKSTGREGFTREKVIRVLTSTGRAFAHGAAEETRRRFPETLKVCGVNESRMAVRYREAEGIAKRKSLFFILVSAPDDERQGCFYRFSPVRDASTVLSMPDPGDGSKPPLRYMVCDSFKGYDRIREEPGKLSAEGEVTLSGCWQHASRRVGKAMDNMGIMELFAGMETEAIRRGVTFSSVLRERVAAGDTVAPVSRLTMLIMAHIKQMYVHEQWAGDPLTDGAVRAAKREEQVRHAMAVMQYAREIALSSPELRVHETATGEERWSGACTGTCAEAAQYLLNNRTCLLNIGLSFIIPIASRDAEQGVRNPARLRRGILFLNSSDSVRSYEDFASLAETCRMNGVVFSDYLLWVVENVKLRIEQLRWDRGCLQQILTEPEGLSAKEYRAMVGEDPLNALYGRLYQPSLDLFPYDSISYEGLDVYTYMELMGLRKNL